MTRIGRLNVEVGATNKTKGGLLLASKDISKWAKQTRKATFDVGAMAIKSIATSGTAAAASLGAAGAAMGGASLSWVLRSLGRIKWLLFVILLLALGLRPLMTSLDDADQGQHHEQQDRRNRIADRPRGNVHGLTAPLAACDAGLGPAPASGFSSTSTTSPSARKGRAPARC